MSGYDFLVGQRFVRNGVRYCVVKCLGATVVAAQLAGDRVDRVFVPLAEVLEALEITEVTVSELPRACHPGSKVGS